jgi:Ca-activated chloride channel homolog
VLEIIPLRFGRRQHKATTMDVLVRVNPPIPERLPQRAALNLGLVLDRSGSMAGTKLEQTIRCAQELVHELGERDRLSVVIFDDRVEILIPSVQVSDKAALLNQLSKIKVGGSTALHGGWLEGSTQVAKFLKADALNRVLLLTDGQANVGQTQPDAICSHVNGLAQRGVSTSTLGFGSDYNESLLRSMAASGDGNHHYVESPKQLASIFELELGGLMATVGQRVRLKLESAGSLEVLTDLERNPQGELRLNDLVISNPLSVLVRVRLNPGQEPALQARLGYYDLVNKRDAVLEQALSLPLVSDQDWDKLHQAEEVVQERHLWESAQARQQVVKELARGNESGAKQILRDTLGNLARLPSTRVRDYHTQELNQLLDDIEQRKMAEAQKRAVQQERSYSYGSVTIGSYGQIKEALEEVKRRAQLDSEVDEAKKSPS